jgi:hypothetical protein
MYVHIYMYMYMCVCVYIYVHTYIYIYARTHTGLHHARALLLAQHGGRGKEALTIWRHLGARSHELHGQLGAGSHELQGAGSHELHQHQGVPEIIHYFTTLVGGIWAPGQLHVDASKWALVTEFCPFILDKCGAAVCIL